MCESNEYITMYSYCARMKVKKAKEEFYVGTVFTEGPSIEEARLKLLVMLEDTVLITEDKLEYIYILPGIMYFSDKPTHKIKKDN